MGKPLTVNGAQFTEVSSALRGSINLGSRLFQSYFTLDGGVYLLSALNDAGHYVGSTQDHFVRLASHIYEFNRDYGAVALDMTNKYH